MNDFIDQNEPKSSETEENPYHVDACRRREETVETLRCAVRYFNGNPDESLRWTPGNDSGESVEFQEHLARVISNPLLDATKLSQVELNKAIRYLGANGWNVDSISRALYYDMLFIDEILYPALDGADNYRLPDESLKQVDENELMR
jgi:hypothetical protein